MNCHRTRRLLFVGLGFCWCTSATASESESLDQKLLDQAPSILKTLRDQNYRSVGILKFLVRRNGNPLSDRVGTLNLDLSTRLELALILKNDVDDPVGIIHDASAIIAKLSHINHKNAATRMALFNRNYPLVWGNQTTKPDAFLCGEAVLSPDLKMIEIVIRLFDEHTETGKEDLVAHFTASTDVSVVVEAGTSTQFREVTQKGGRASTLPLKAKKVEPPVDLEIRYNGVRVVPTFVDGENRIREPVEGEKIEFFLRKLDKEDVRYGVVLRVNGLNTVESQKISVLSATPWVLDNKHPEAVILGFQSGTTHAWDFEVLPPKESEAGELDYGAFAGKIDMVVFSEQPDLAVPSFDDPEAENRAIMGRNAIPTNPASSPRALAAQISDEFYKPTNRGLMKKGDKKSKSPVTLVQFKRNPNPIMISTITYYRFKKRKAIQETQAPKQSPIPKTGTRSRMNSN